MEPKMWRLKAAAGIALLAGTLAGAAPSFAAGPQAAALKADGNAQALGIDDATPRLSWKLDGTPRGGVQTSYEIVVAKTAEKAAAGHGDVWDSGRVTSDALGAAYAGPPLGSRTRYHWSVGVSTNSAATLAWAPASWFETAYLNPSEFKGSWIAGPARPTAPLTTAQASADDACCLQANTTLAAPAAAGDTNLKVASVAALTAGQVLNVEGESFTATAVGTAPATSTTLVMPAAAGD